MRLLAITTCILASTLSTAAQSPPQPLRTYFFTITGGQQFTDTQVDVKAGEVLKITATGVLHHASNPQREIGPAGAPRGWADLIRSYPVLDGPRAALVGRVSDRETARAFLIGAAHEQTVGLDGRLYLGINELASDQYTGAYSVRVERYAPVHPLDPATLATLPQFTQDLLDSVPPQVHDSEGRLGDRVNFFVIGSGATLKAALDRGGWTKVDTSVRQAVIDGLVNSFSKQAYVSMPMSSLMLFNRIQDFGYAQGDPLRIVASRHHFRLWKAPFQLGGRTVWAGAATHDIGFVRDHRTYGITHRIDPDIDKEREYVAASIKESGLVAKIDYMTGTRAVKEAHTASGAAFHSDGRTAVIYLLPETTAGPSASPSNSPQPVR